MQVKVNQFRKDFLVSSNSSKKNEWTNSFLVMLGKKPKFICSFLEEWLAWKKHYDFIWPLRMLHEFMAGPPRHYCDVSSIPIEPAVTMRYHGKRGKVPWIRVISFRKTSLSILKTHLTWRLRSCISTLKIVPTSSYKNEY